MAAAFNPAYGVLADAFSYPAPGRLSALRGALAGLPPGAAKDAYAAFIRGIEPLTLGAWEELHTRTLDLNPPAAPYIGYQVWGESYPRGAFLSQMSRALAETGIDTEGELPDHVAPCLRYLSRTADPLPELVEAFPLAMGRMLQGLREAQPDNPYVNLLIAVQAAAQSLQQKEAA
jgi:nitrate reductase molybdenum cofactor assembly chaperone NarJ/NarW